MLMLQVLKTRASMLRVVSVLGLAMLLSSAANAQTAAKGTPAEGKTKASAQGSLRQPTPEEARALSAAMSKLVNRSTEGLVVKEHADGMKSIDLQGRFQSVSVARRNADGTIEHSCVNHAGQAHDFVKAKANTKKKAVRPAAEVK